MKDMQPNDWIQTLQNDWLPLLIEYGLQALFALFTLVVGWWLINRAVTALAAVLQKRKADAMLTGFLSSLLSTLLRILLLLSVVGMLGIETTSFIALIGAAGLAVGLALQGSLANFAGGVLILFLRPFRAGDFIEAQGISGTVESILIFHTILRTADNKTIIMPNGSLSNGSITNYSTKPTRRVDINVGISYDDDIKKAREILLGLAAADERVLKDPAAVVYMTSLGDSSVNISLRMWTQSADFWGVFFEMQEKMKDAFDRNGIHFPYPQRTVHINPLED